MKYLHFVDHEQKGGLEKTFRAGKKLNHDQWIYYLNRKKLRNKKIMFNLIRSMYLASTQIKLSL